VRSASGAFFQATGSRIADDVRAYRALTVFIDTGSAVGGDLKADRTAQVFAFNSTLNGIDVTRSTDRVQVCGNSIDGNVEVEDSGRDILFGDPQAVDCAGNTLRNGHSAKFEDNFTDVEFVVRGNTFAGGDLTVEDNSGPSDKFVQDNTGGDRLACSGNEDPFTGTPNTFTSESGQCAEV